MAELPKPAPKDIVVRIARTAGKEKADTLHGCLEALGVSVTREDDTTNFNLVLRW